MENRICEECGSTNQPTSSVCWMCDAELAAPVRSPVRYAEVVESRNPPNQEFRYSLKGLMIFTTLMAIAFAVARQDLVFGLILGGTTIPAIFATWKARRETIEAGSEVKLRGLFFVLCESVLINAFIGAAACLGYVFGQGLGWLIAYMFGATIYVNVVGHFFGVLMAAMVLLFGYWFRKKQLGELLPRD